MVFDFLKHPDIYISSWLDHYGTLTYAILFLIVFAETGLVVTPLLPGDSLLFTAGALASSTGKLDIAIIIPLLIAAALLGDNVNYFVGRFFGHLIKDKERILFFKREYVTRTEEFYVKHGGQAVVLARFVPIVRTIAPFVAGAGSMVYRRYILFCVLGAVLWVGGITSIGYALGTNDWIKKNIELVLIGIVLISVLPIFWGIIKAKISSPKA